MLICWRSNGANPTFQQCWGAPFHLLGTSLRSVLGFPPMTEVILFSSGGDCCFTVFTLEWQVLILLPALCFKTWAKPSLLRPVPGVEVRGGTGGCGLRVLIPVLTGGYRRKHSVADGSSVPYRQEATWIFLAGTAACDWLQPEACREMGVAVMGRRQLCHCLSAVVALVLAASPQLQRTSSLRFRAPVCWVWQPGVGTCRCQVPDWDCVGTVLGQTHHCPGGEETEG